MKLSRPHRRGGSSSHRPVRDAEAVTSRLRAWWRSLDEDSEPAEDANAKALVKAARRTSKSGSLSVFGDSFGRPGDNNHSIIGAEVEPGNCALVLFDEHETLRVWDPDGIHGGNEFRVERASRVRWEWYSYGDPRTPENLYYIEHRVVGDNVEVSTNARWGSYGPLLRHPAVELLDGLA